MIISAKKNTNYGGSLINQKYTPLDNLNIVNEEKDNYVGLFNSRITSFSSINAFPVKLSLISAWPASPIHVANAPMVVISSNRAEWLRKIFDNATAKGATTGYNDTETFDNGLSPWYWPQRSQRILYVVVQNSEYGYYKSQIGNNRYPNVYVVGWRFPYAKGKFGIGPTGFGASRFAALEMLKDIGYHQAWTADDNVVNVNGFPNTLATIEALMNDDMWGIGFSAATMNFPHDDTFGEATFTTTAFDFSAQKAGLLQQVVLWNIDNLRTNKLNMSPYFVCSNEDVSFSNYLQVYGYAEKVIKSLSVIKTQPENDSKANKGAAVLAGLREATLKLLFETEKANQVNDGSGAANINTFIKEKVLKGSAGAATPLAVTQSQAIEQALAEAVSNKWAPAKIFNPYSGFGDDDARVERLPG